MKIALIQSNPLTSALTENMDALMSAAARAAELGADLCVAPELALCGHCAGDLLLTSGYADDCRAVLNNAAARMGKDSALPPLLLGAPVANPSPVGKSLQSCAVLLDKGEVRVVGRKVLLPSFGVHDEARYFEPGVTCGVLHLNGWRLGVTIGEDAWNDRGFWQNRRTFTQDPVADFMAAGGADGLLNLTVLPFEQGLPALHQRVISHMAARYHMPVAVVNMTGGSDSLVHYGGSMAFDRSGALTARAPAFEEALLLVDFSGRAPAPIAPMPEGEEALWRAIVLGLRDFVRKSGFETVVLGLSGGVDSSLVAALAAEAFGPDKVTGLLMPSPYSSKGSIDDSLALAAGLGIRTHTLPITPALDTFRDIFRQGLGEELQGLTEENIQARIRSNLLMAWANGHGALLLATGNKSEAAVGYSTLYGDLSGALAPIGDLYKGEVYALCRWHNSRHPEAAIPETVLAKAPSAELRPGQKDEDSLPPYEMLDALLEGIFERARSYDQLVEEGYAPELVRSVLHMVQKAEFKRRQAPPSLHLSSRSFGAGLRIPVTAAWPIITDA